MTRWPLRWRVALWSAASTGAILVLFGGATAATLFVQQVRSVDAELVRDARLLRAQPGSGVPTMATQLAAVYSPWLQIAVKDRRGTPAGGGGRLAESAAQASPPQPAWSSRWERGAVWRIHREAIGEYDVVFARSLDMQPDVGDELVAAYLLSTPVALALAALAAWWLGRQALRPIGELAGAARAITADQLGTRLPESPADDELALLARVLNAMLERLERSFHQTRRFAADASHELRTPLTIMRGEIEAALREGGLSASQEKRILSLLDETGRLDRITESLLTLAQFDAGGGLPELKPLDLSLLVSDAAEDAELLGAHKRLAFEARIAPAVRVRGDRIHLRRLLLNLVDNAVKFNVPEGQVRIDLSAVGEEAVLRVANTGPGIAPEGRRLLFERFSRLSPSRESQRGSGLGLSLCREIAAAHGGSLDLAESSGPQWTEFVLRLPLAHA